MPAIKKKWIAENQGNGEMAMDENGGGDDEMDTVSPTFKAKKRSAQPPGQGGMLRGLDGEVLSEKRKRVLPPAEQKLSDWLDNNLESKANTTVSVQKLYNFYFDLCQGSDADILDIPEFSKMIRDKFGKERHFGMKESSVYKPLIKEKKTNEAKKKEGGGIKLKEAVHEAINHYGNPWNGVRFFNVKQYIGTKYPYFQIDTHPKKLRWTLEMGMQHGQIDLVKGIGMAGFYKLPGGEPPPPKKTKQEKKKQEDGKAEGEEGGEKSAESADGGEKKEGEEEVEKKKKPKKEKVIKKLESFSRVPHSDPQKIEDVFPMAITYQSAPKTASISKIRSYILNRYREEVPDHRLRQVIESGIERGSWENISGSGMSGRLHLLMDDFDPESEKTEDMIAAAIIATHEPKSASANQIKKYIANYFPDFKVDERPDKFKKALIRAVETGAIARVSGLGAAGSFELAIPFIPSPTVLAGEAASESEEESEYDSDGPVYIPKGTKSRGMPKVKTMEVVKSPPPKSRTTATSKKGKGKPAKDSRSGKKSKAGGKSSRAPSRKPKYAERSSDEESEEESEEDVELEYTPRKTQSRGGTARGSATPASKGRAKTIAKASSQKKTKPAPKAKTPSKKTKETATPKKNATPKNVKSKSPVSSTSKKASAVKAKSSLTGKTFTRLDMSNIDDRKPKSKSSGKKGRPTPSKSSKRSKVMEDSDDADVDSEPDVEYTPRKSKSRGGK